MNDPIILRGGEVLSPAQIAEAEVLMPVLNSRIVASQSEGRVSS